MLKLNLPFHPRRLSGFKSGNFLIYGSDENYKASQIVLLDSTGQLLRYIEFPKEKQESAEKSLMRSLGTSSSETVATLLLSSFTSFFPYQDKVLYIRGRSGAPIYAISEGGEARNLKIKAPDDYAIESFLSSDSNWFVVTTETGKFSDTKSVVYEMNPTSHELLGRYVVEGAGKSKSISEGQSDLAYFHGGEFLSVRHQAGKLAVLHGKLRIVQRRQSHIHHFVFARRLDRCQSDLRRKLEYQRKFSVGDSGGATIDAVRQHCRGP